MTITIGEKKLAIRKPVDLDAELQASTGCSAKEIAAQLSGASTAAHLARALHPHLGDDAPPVQDLATMIAAADLADVGRQVTALYAPAQEVKRAPAKPAAAKPGRVAAKAATKPAPVASPPPSIPAPSADAGGA